MYLTTDREEANDLLQETSLKALDNEEKYTLALFKRGTEIAAERGLIFVDTKYEFGKHNGTPVSYTHLDVYKRQAYQLQQVNHNEQTDQLVGRECVIYFKQSDSKYTVQTTRDLSLIHIWPNLPDFPSKTILLR